MDCRRTNFLVSTDLRGVLVVGEEYAEIFVDLRAAGEASALAQPVAPGPGRSCCRHRERCAISCQRERGRLGPSTISRSTSSMRSSALDAERGRHLRGRGLGAARRIGPGHEMIAAEAGLAHHILEGDVGGARHRGQQRAADRAVGRRARHRAARRDWRAPSSRSGRGRRARRSAPARWPRTETAAAAGCTARGWSAPSARPASPARRRTVSRAACAASRSGWAMPASRIAASSAASSSVTQWPSVVNTRSAMLAAAALVKVMHRIFSGGTPDEQQADHALHQHMGLARAGIGRHERGRRRIGRARLRVADGGGNGARRLHHSSSPMPPAADHSLIRARSS